MILRIALLASLSMFFSVQNSNAFVQDVAMGELNRIESCGIRSINSTMSGVTRRINNYASNMERSVNAVLSMESLDRAIVDIEDSIGDVERDYNRLYNNVTKPFLKAYDAFDRVIFDNLDAALAMTEAMKNEEDWQGVVFEGGREVSRRVGGDRIIDEVDNTLGMIPPYSSVDERIAELSGQSVAVKAEEENTRKKESNTLKNIAKFEKAASTVSGEKFDVNDYIRDLDKMAKTRDLMNLEKTDLPQELAVAVNVASFGGELLGFTQRTGGQIEIIENIISLISNVEQIQSLQSGAFTAIEVADQAMQALDLVSEAVSMFSGGFDPNKAKDMYKQGERTYKGMKSSLSDLEKTAERFKQFRREVSNLKRGLEREVNAVERAFSGSVDVGELIIQISNIPKMKVVGEQYAKFLDIQKEATDYRSHLLRFGSSTASTEKVLSDLEPYAQPVKDKVKDIGDSLKDKFNKKDEEAETEAHAAEIASAENSLGEIKDKSSSTDAKKAKLRANFEYLRQVYKAKEGGERVLKSIDAAERKIDRLPTGDQLKRMADNGLEVTRSVKTINNSYSKILKFKPEMVMGPLDDLSDNIDKITDAKNLMRDFNNVAKQLENSKQLVNGIQGSIQNMGGILKCFNINPTAIINDLLVRVQDMLIEDIKLRVWNSYGWATGDIPYIMLPSPKGPKVNDQFLEKWYKNLPTTNEKGPNGFNHRKPFDAQKNEFHTALKDAFERNKNISQTLALEGVMFAQAEEAEETYNIAPSRTMGDYTYSDGAGMQEGYNREMRYEGRALSAWDYKFPSFKPSLSGTELNYGDFRAKGLTPFACGGVGDSKSFCWYWKWHSCYMIPKCYPVPYPLPTCDTELAYKEPTVHLEISPRAGTSHLGHLELLKDIPSSIDDWSVGGEQSAVPAAHVFGISPLARHLSKLNPFFSTHTMVCDLAPDWDKFEYIQYFTVPLPQVKIAMKSLLSFHEISDWNDRWFNKKTPLTGVFPTPLSALYVSELDKFHWNPRTYPSGRTPTGEGHVQIGNQIVNFEDVREDAYKYVLPYTVELGEDVSPTEMKLMKDKNNRLFVNKCAAKAENDGTNICIGDWGALFPRNGQVATFDPRSPLKRDLLLEWRAYDRVLEHGYEVLDPENPEELEGTAEERMLIKPSKIQDGTFRHGVGYENTEFSIEWPFRTKRFKIGEDTRMFEQGYYGNQAGSGGLVMTLWRDTRCCVRVCCPVPSFNEGDTYPLGGGSTLRSIWKIEVEEWQISDVVQKDWNGLDPEVANLIGDDLKRNRKHDPNEIMDLAYDKCMQARLGTRSCMKSAYNIETKEQCMAHRRFNARDCNMAFPSDGI